MYKWYRNAEICYAYLEDIPTKWDVISRPDNVFDPNGCFRNSRWFTRGWTLQELIAPPVLDFFSADWHHLGTKVTFLSQISSITSIPDKILSGTKYLSECSAAERMSWAATRNTTRPEDAAYSLMGIFDIHMPLIYGEGGKKAFLRLQSEILSTSSVDFSLFAYDLWQPPQSIHGLHANKSEKRRGWIHSPCHPLANSPRQFRNDKVAGLTYSNVKSDSKLLVSVQNRNSLNVRVLATGQGVEACLPTKQAIIHNLEHCLVFTGCTIGGKLLCIGRDAGARRTCAESRLTGGFYMYWLVDRQDISQFSMTRLFFQFLKPIQDAPVSRAPRLRSFSTDNDTCLISLDVKELEHCSTWRTAYLQSQGDQEHGNDGPEQITIAWLAARKGRHEWEGKYVYTAYALPCITDSQDVFCLFLNEVGVAIWPSSAKELGVEIAAVEQVAPAVIATGKELNTSSQIWGEVCPNIDKDVDVMRFGSCAVAATYKQCHGGARVMLSSWAIERQR